MILLICVNQKVENNEKKFYILLFIKIILVISIEIYFLAVFLAAGFLAAGLEFFALRNLILSFPISSLIKLFLYKKKQLLFNPNCQLKGVWKTYSLLGSHEFESVKIGEIGLDFGSGQLFGPAALSPQLLNVGLGPRLSESLLASTVWNLNQKFGQIKTLDIDCLTANTSGWSIN